MNNILDHIIDRKKDEVQQLALAYDEGRISFDETNLSQVHRSLSGALLQDGNSGIIAEFKRKSPSKGWFKPSGLNVERVVEDYNEGAAGISVLTDEFFFGGSLDDLSRARTVTTVPLLRKDFIIDEIQILQARAYGADVVLLIAACLSPDQVAKLSAYATSIGLEVLLELHDESELEHISADTILIGINNRDLKTFEVDIKRSLKMAEKISTDKILIGESGIDSIDTIRIFRESGFKGFLIGEKFMKEEDPGKAFKKFQTSLQETIYK